MAKKYYVLDTNILLESPDAVYGFQDNIVVVPATVLQELDRHKRDNGETGYNARESIRILEEVVAEDVRQVVTNRDFIESFGNTVSPADIINSHGLSVSEFTVVVGIPVLHADRFYFRIGKSNDFCRTTTTTGLITRIGNQRSKQEFPLTLIRIVTCWGIGMRLCKGEARSNLVILPQQEPEIALTSRNFLVIVCSRHDRVVPSNINRIPIVIFHLHLIPHVSLTST